MHSGVFKWSHVLHRYRKDFHFAMSDDEENQEDMKAFGFDDSGGEFSLGCYGVHSEKYPMSEIDEWDEDEVCVTCNFM